MHTHTGKQKKTWVGLVSAVFSARERNEKIKRVFREVSVRDMVLYTEFLSI